MEDLFNATLGNLQRMADDIIYSFLPSEDELGREVRTAMNYSVQNGGKRLRPILMYLTYKMLGGNKLTINKFMAAIEMIHSYSLVHDDLPAMDNDTLRRGKITTWKAFGEDIGILAGDGLLNLAFETGLSAFDAPDENPINIANANKILAHKAGINGMIGGQSVDVFNSGKKLDFNTLDYIHKNKTCALIEASFMIGGILANAEDFVVSKLENIGYNLGMAFQIQDDILDVIGDEKQLGKHVHMDEKNEKTTYVSLFGLDEARKYVEKFSNEAIRELNTFADNEFKKYLYNIFVMLINRSK